MRSGDAATSKRQMMGQQSAIAAPFGVREWPWFAIASVISRHPDGMCRTQGDEAHGVGAFGQYLRHNRRDEAQPDRKETWPCR